MQVLLRLQQPTRCRAIWEKKGGNKHFYDILSVFGRLGTRFDYKHMKQKGKHGRRSEQQQIKEKSERQVMANNNKIYKRCKRATNRTYNNNEQDKISMNRTNNKY